MSEPIRVTRDQALLGFLRVKYPEQVAETERLVDSLIEQGVTGIYEPVAAPGREKEGDQ